MSTTPPWALKIIAAAKASGDGTLDLGGLRDHTGQEPLREVPFEIFDLKHIRRLSLAYNKISEVPLLSKRLSNLEFIDLRWNDKLEDVADQPGVALDCSYYKSRRGRLTDLNVAGLRFEAGEVEDVAIERFTGLRILDLARCELREVPPAVLQLSLLEELNLSGNHLESLPSGLRRLTHLVGLYLSGNKLRRIPEEVFDLVNLRELSLATNEIDTLPPTIENLTQLQVLTLNSNHLRVIPLSVFELPRIETLTIGGNPIKNLPPELIPGDRQYVDLAKIRAYFRQLRESGVKYLCEAKLIVVGEGEAGKTTLVKKLLDPQSALDPHEAATEGIDVADWRFPAQIRVDDRGHTRYLDTDIDVHIWDFAGQEINYSTHQFFLTKRSLYVLVVDNRRDNPNFDYWLNIIELLSDGSPLLVVKNEKQDLLCNFDERAARARFGNIKEVLSSNPATNRGVATVTAMIRAQLQTLPHIGTPLPATWIRVRDELVELRHQHNYISRDDVLALCEQHGFRGLEDKLQLMEYLHDLGTCLHFEDDPGLAGIVILRPEWATQAVYRVLRDRLIGERDGRFERADLVRIWSAPVFEAVRTELLELMRKFKLCYPLGETGQYMIPQLLPRSRPSYEWDDSRNLHVYYEYDFMPKGILPRLTVALHRAIERQNWVWQNGAIFTRDGARAEVVEDQLTRKIRIRVVGPNRLQLLGAITHVLDDIHSVYRRLTVRRMIPCQCASCASGTDPFFLLSEQVHENMKRGWKAMQCHRSGEMVPVEDLVRAVGDEVDRLPQVSEIGRAGDRPAVRDVSTGDVFVSYAWGEESEEMVDRIEEAFRARGVHIVRDKKALAYKADIAGFMARLARGDAIVCVVSDRYLRSDNCMRELVQIDEATAATGAFVNRIFPIVLPDAKIYDLTDRIDYVEYWERKRNQLADKMKKVDQQNLQGFREGIDLYDRIRDTLARITNVLGNLNALTPDHHADEDFETLFNAIFATVKVSLT